MRRQFIELLLLSAAGLSFAVPVTQCPCGRIILCTDTTGVVVAYSRIVDEKIYNERLDLDPKDGYCYQTYEYEVTPTKMNLTIQYNRIGEFENRLQEGRPNAVEFGNIVKLALRCNSIESCLYLSTKDIRTLTNSFAVYNNGGKAQLSRVQMDLLKSLNFFVKRMREDFLRPPRTASHDFNYIPEMLHYGKAMSAAKSLSVEEPTEATVEPEAPYEDEQPKQKTESKELQIGMEGLVGIMCCSAVLISSLTLALMVYYLSLREGIEKPMTITEEQFEKFMEILDACDRMDSLIEAKRRVYRMLEKISMMRKYCETTKNAASIAD